MSRTKGDYRKVGDFDNLWMTGRGQYIVNVHAEAECKSEFCVVHNPSDHHMREWPTHFRYDRGITERICPHGVGHPDPDDPTEDTVHGCDGCCAEEKQ